MDISAISGAAGALIGVALGASLNTRSQRQLRLAAEARAEFELRRQVYVEFLTSYQQLYRHVLTSADVRVTVVVRPDGSQVPLVTGGSSEALWRQVDAADMNAEALTGDSPLRETTLVMLEALREVMIARSRCGPGEVASELTDAFDAAQFQLIMEGQADLRRRQSGAEPGPSIPSAWSWTRRR